VLGFDSRVTALKRDLLGFHDEEAQWLPPFLLKLRDLLTQLHKVLGAPGDDQIRLLVCQGPRMLAWIGAAREEPFRRREVAALQSVAAPLRPRLLAQKQRTSARWHEAALESLVDTLDEPAIVFHTRGTVELANEAGLRWLDEAHARRAFEPLRSALATGGTHPQFTLIPLDARGGAGYVLALSTERRGSLSGTVARASRAWNLSPRQSSVLEQVAFGKSNKEIAFALSCAEVTVEKCLTKLFRASGARSRTELAARLHDP
jgi:DNA-binding CsgD family transcriptional regulator